MTQANGSGDIELRLLAFFAHPDDEVFSCGGVMALNRQRGIRNVLVCATKGEEGEISSPEYAEPSNLGRVREQELREAARHMGIDDLHFLGYRDSGMAGTPENDNPAAYTNADASAVVPRLVRFIRTVRPQVIITFDPDGAYGHPDHIAIHNHTVAALHAAADPQYHPALGAAWQAQRLFYPAFRLETFKSLREHLIAQGFDAPDWGADETEFKERAIDAIVDVSRVAAAKWTAFKSHRTQFGPENPFMKVPEEFAVRLLAEEAFEQGWPNKRPATPYPDLFAGLAR